MATKSRLQLIRGCWLWVSILVSGCGPALIPRALAPARKYDAQMAETLEAYQAGRIDEALAAVQKAQRERPDDASMYEWEALLHEDLGEADLQADALHALLKSRPDSAELHCSAGHMLIVLGRRAEGLAAMHRAVVLQPQSADFVCRLAGAYLEAGADEDALTVLTSAPNQNHPQIVLAVARLRESRGEWQQATEQYAKMVRRQPDACSWRLQRARCLMRIDDVASAVADYEFCWQADRSTLDLADLIEFGGACLAVDNPSLASQLFHEAVRRGHSSSELAALRAVAAYREGRLDACERTIAAARSQWPEDPTLAALEERLTPSQVVPASATMYAPATDGSH